MPRKVSSKHVAMFDLQWRITFCVIYYTYESARRNSALHQLHFYSILVETRHKWRTAIASTTQKQQEKNTPSKIEEHAKLYRYL